MERLLYLDVETGGLEPSDGIVEIAWIEFDAQLNEINRVHSLIDPEKPISPSAMGVHHITDAMVADQPTIREFLDVVVPDYFKDGDEVVMVAHNAHFDRKFVAPHLPVVEDVCTLRLARYFWPDAPDHKLQTLRYLHKLEGGEGAHGALQDCETGLALLRFMCLDRGISFRQLRDYMKGPLPVKKIPFGKHRGSLLTDLPRGYRVWLLGTDIDADLRHSLEAL